MITRLRCLVRFPRGSGRPGGARAVLQIPEFRTLAVAGLLSAAGDQLARVALSVLVYDRTDSALLTALTYALTFLPAVVGGPLLAGLADRRPRRQLMVTINVVQAVLVTGMAVAGTPLPVLLGLLVGVNVLAGPFSAARAALTPDVTGDRYMSALVVDRTFQQTAQLAGFLGTGLLLLAVSPSAAMLADAASFAASAVLLHRGLHHRPAAAGPPAGEAPDGPAVSTPAMSGWPARLRHAGGDAAAGAAAIWADRRVRRAVLLIWVVSGFAVVPEGLAAPYARQLVGGPLLVAVLLAANPAGNVVSGLWATRWSRQGAGAALAVLAQLALLPLAVCALSPPAAVVVAVIVISGIGMTVSLLARTVFVTHIAPAVRGRAFAVAGTGIIVSQGIALAAAGTTAALGVAPSTVVGGAGLVGSVVTAVLLLATRSPADPVAAVHPLRVDTARPNPQ